MGMYVLCTMQWFECVLFFFLIQLATPQMTCSSCGRQETLCRWMKLLYHSLTSDRKISIMGTAPNTMQEQVQSVFIILYIMCRFFGESVSPEFFFFFKVNRLWTYFNAIFRKCWQCWWGYSGFRRDFDFWSSNVNRPRSKAKGLLGVVVGRSVFLLREIRKMLMGLLDGVEWLI